MKDPLLYQTPDFYLAAYLKLVGCGTPRVVHVKKQILFSFKWTEALDVHVAAYMDGRAAGNIPQFVQALGTLKMLASTRAI